MLHIFIINSFAGKGGFSEYIRTELEKKKNIEYLIFNSEYPGHEGALAAQLYELFENETIRFYACGGSGTFRNIMNSLPNLDRVEFAEIPYGQKERFKGEDGEKYRKFLDLDAMINGKTIMCDYVDTNIGRAHKSLSSGLEVNFVDLQKRLNDGTFVSGNLAGFIASVYAFFKRSSLKARYVIDGMEINGKYSQFSVYSTAGLRISGYTGGGENDGKFDVILMPKRNLFVRWYIFWAIKSYNRKVIDKYCYTVRASEIEIYTGDADSLFAFDGEIVRAEHIEAKVVQGLRYVIPSGLEIGGQER